MGGHKKSKAGSAAEYIGLQPASHQPTMRSLRSLVQDAIPEASERITYGIICFEHHYLLVGIGATKRAVSLHLMNPRLATDMKDELTGVRHSGATLHFPPDEPLPTALISELVRRRAKENEERAARQSVPRNSAGHYAVAKNAARRARDVLGLFEAEHPRDRRPRAAIDAIEEWAAGKRDLSMSEVRKLSLSAHAAAREAASAAATFAARAAGHAIATWHVPSHAEGATLYAAKALSARAALTSS